MSRRQARRRLRNSPRRSDTDQRVPVRRSSQRHRALPTRCDRRRLAIRHGRRRRRRTVSFARGERLRSDHPADERFSYISRILRIELGNILHARSFPRYDSRRQLRGGCTQAGRGKQRAVLVRAPHSRTAASRAAIVNGAGCPRLRECTWRLGTPMRGTPESVSRHRLPCTPSRTRRGTPWLPVWTRANERPRAAHTAR